MIILKKIVQETKKKKKGITISVDLTILEYW